MPIPCKISIDAGTLISVSAAATVIVQGTNSSSKPIILNRIELQSSNIGSSQQSIQVSLGTYTTGTSTGGSTPVATPVEEGLIGVYTPSTTFRAGTTTLGTTFTQRTSWQWNTASFFDEVMGNPNLQIEIPASKVWALILPSAPVAFNLSGTVYFSECG